MALRRPFRFVVTTRLYIVVVVVFARRWSRCSSSLVVVVLFARAVFATTQKTTTFTTNGGKTKVVNTQKCRFNTRMGDTCCNPSSLGAIEEAVKKEVSSTTTKVMSIRFDVGSVRFHLRVSRTRFDWCTTMGASRSCEKREKKKGAKRYCLDFQQGGVFARAMVELAEMKQT